MRGDPPQRAGDLTESSLGQVGYDLLQYRIDGIVKLVGGEVTRLLREHTRHQFIEHEVDGMGTVAFGAGLELQEISSDSHVQIAAIEVVLKKRKRLRNSRSRGEMIVS